MSLRTTRRKLRRAALDPAHIWPYVRTHLSAARRMVRQRRFAEALAFVPRIVGIDVYRSYLRARSEDGVVKRRIYDNEMSLPVSDPGISAELLWRRTHEPRTTAAFRRELAALRDATGPVTVLEIGANIGYYCLLEAAALDDATIYAVEPLPENVGLLRRNLELNGHTDRTDVTQGVISDTDGRETLYLSEKSNGARVAAPPPFADSGERIAVDAWRLDTFVTRRGIDPADVAVVRMDVEGHEAAVLRGMRDVLDSTGPLLLYIEVHRALVADGTLDEVASTLDDAGLTLVSGCCEPIFDESVCIDSLDALRTFDFERWENLGLVLTRGVPDGSPSPESSA